MAGGGSISGLGERICVFGWQCVVLFFGGPISFSRPPQADVSLDGPDGGVDTPDLGRVFLFFGLCLVHFSSFFWGDRYPEVIGGGDMPVFVCVEQFPTEFTSLQLLFGEFLGRGVAHLPPSPAGIGAVFLCVGVDRGGGLLLASRDRPSLGFCGSGVECVLWHRVPVIAQFFTQTVGANRIRPNRIRPN